MADNWISGGNPFKGRRIDSKGNVKYKGHMIISSHELQFVLSKPKTKDGRTIEKEIYPLKDIKSYGSHENVLSVNLGGESVILGEGGMVYFKLKEAVVVKEIMEQVIEMKKKPTPRMPSFDFVGGFYDMTSPTSAISKPFPGSDVSRKQSLGSMQENLSYYDPSRMQTQNSFESSYSRAKLERSTSTGSSCSSGGPPSATLIQGHEAMSHDNPLFQFSPNEMPVQYAKVEMSAQRLPVSPEDPFSPPPQDAGPGKRKFPLFKSKSAPKFGYTKVDIDVMEALRELDTSSKKK